MSFYCKNFTKWVTCHAKTNHRSFSLNSVPFYCLICLSGGLKFNSLWLKDKNSEKKETNNITRRNAHRNIWLFSDLTFTKQSKWVFCWLESITLLFHCSDYFSVSTQMVLMYYSCACFSGATDWTNSDPPGKDFLFGGPNKQGHWGRSRRKYGACNRGKIQNSA